MAKAIASCKALYLGQWGYRDCFERVLLHVVRFERAIVQVLKVIQAIVVSVESFERANRVTGIVLRKFCCTS